MRTQDSRLILPVFLVALSLLSPVIPGSWGWAEEARTPKGPDVTTSGTGPYTGPTPAELAKVATHEATPEAIPVAKTPDVITVSREEGNVLTPAELAKLRTLLEVLLVPEMVKLPAMEVPKDGIPEMTAAEREKLTQRSRSER